MGSPEIIKTPELLIGASCHEVIKEILGLNPEIKTIRFTRYRYVPQAIAKDREEPHFWLTREELLEDRLEQEVAELPEGYELGIHSQVRMKDGQERLLPMMDFKILLSSENLSSIRERMQAIVGTKGWILESDKSYHFYGMSPENIDDWLNFCGRCLLTSIIKDEGRTITDLVDARYVGHCLLRRANVLRVSTNVKEVMPKVVAFI
jgi:hypothetical protein